jgi:hypothetical protein
VIVDGIFGVMTQVDHVLTNVSGFDSADSVISTNTANLKPGHHSLPPLKKSRPEICQQDWINPFRHDRGYKGERHIHLHFSTSRIHGTKDTWCTPRFLNVLREGAGDECVHEKLRADGFRLR